MEIYVKAFAVKEEGIEEWLGAWAPIPATQVDENIFLIEENACDEADDYEFYVPGTKVVVEEIISQIDGDTFLGVVEKLDR